MARKKRNVATRTFFTSLFAILALLLLSSSIAGNRLDPRGTRNHASEGASDPMAPPRESADLLSGITVAVLNEGTSPSYFSGAQTNDYIPIVTALSAEGASVTALTSSQIASGALGGYDVFVMVDNVPSAACQAGVREAWMTGTAIMAFDSSSCALCYFGILPACSMGSNGQGTYWAYGDTGASRIVAAHPITADYAVNAKVTGTSGDAYWLSSTMGSVSEAADITVLTSLDGDTFKWTTIIYEPASYAPVFFCWDEGHVKNTALAPMIVQAVKYLASSTGHAPTLTSG
ncbi:MAG: hypothetical protein JW839_16035 [Candidatus Lokiarchaeota archaeon]|nr:hypothetical protein [Candidatus Lokiarchaeota archaeon]